jgi:hypothetical protein
MTEVPRSGLRHAATLLLTNRARALASDASRHDIVTALEQLAHDLVALARDMRAGPESASWLFDEYRSTVERLPHTFHREEPLGAARAIIGRVASFTYDATRRDFFLIHVPEDRLGAAALLAIELTKRRLTVALAEYEVTTAGELAEALERGLEHHAAGIVLVSLAFERRQLPASSPHPRLRRVTPEDWQVVLDDIATWISLTRKT